MGWIRRGSVGKRTVILGFSRSGSYRRCLDRGRNPDEVFRLSGRHLRLILGRHRPPAPALTPAAPPQRHHGPRPT
jgi:hypothetical protein